MQVPVPTPILGQVIVKVMSSSVNHLDLLWKVIKPSLAWKAFVTAWSVQSGFPKVLGLDVAGVVVAVDPFVTHLHVGDEVWGFNAAGCVFDGHMLGGISGHTWAEYVAIDANQVGLKPSGMNFTEAGAAPLAAQTALGALTLAGAPWIRGPGTVLVLGATGGVGHFAAQLAKALGATNVIATASESHRAFVTSLGVDQFIDYHSSNWWDESVIPDHSLMAVIDTVLQPLTGERAFRKLQSHGKFVTLCKGIPDCGAPGWDIITQLKDQTISQRALRCTAGSCAGVEHLDKLRHFVDAGKLKIHLDKVVPLANFSDAIFELENGHVVGKIGITVGNSIPLNVI